MKTSTEQKVGSCKLQSYQSCSNSANKSWKVGSFAEYMEQWLSHCWWGCKSLCFLLKARGLYEGSWRCSNPTRLPGLLCACPRETQPHLHQKSHTARSQAICSQRETCKLHKYSSQEKGKTHIIRWWTRRHQWKTKKNESWNYKHPCQHEHICKTGTWVKNKSKLQRLGSIII